MPEKHIYVLGINAYDHDVSACLLRDGEIAFAISKERITRKSTTAASIRKSSTTAWRPKASRWTTSIWWCATATCCRSTIWKMRMLSQDVPEIMDDEERDAGREASAVPCTLRQGGDGLASPGARLQRVRRLPLRRGRRDGGGRRRQLCADVTEPDQLTDGVNPLARELESYYRFKGSKLETLKKVWLDPVRGFLSDEFYYMPGLGALYSRVSSYIFADWNKCGEVMGLAPYGRPDAVKPLLEIKDGELDVPSGAANSTSRGWSDRERTGKQSPSMQHWEDMAWRVQDDAEKVLLDARQLAARNDRRQEPVHGRRRRRSIASPTGGSCARRVSTMSGSSRPPATTASPSAAPITAISRSRKSRARSS